MFICNTTEFSGYLFECMNDVFSIFLSQTVWLQPVLTSVAWLSNAWEFFSCLRIVLCWKRFHYLFNCSYGNRRHTTSLKEAAYLHELYCVWIISENLLIKIDICPHSDKDKHTMKELSLTEERNKRTSVRLVPFLCLLFCYFRRPW